LGLYLCGNEWQFGANISRPLSASHVGLTRSLESVEAINNNAGAANAIIGAGMATAIKSVGVTSKTIKQSSEFTEGFKDIKAVNRGLGVATTGIDMTLSYIMLMNIHLQKII
jgi:hypothetical protein